MSGIPNSLDGRIYDAIVADLSRRYPGYRVVAKEQSLLMRFFAVLMKPVNPNFGSTYITTIGRTTYMPQARIDARSWTTLAHEGVHVGDYAASPVAYTLGYVMPQALAACSLLALLAIWFSPWWLCSLAALGLLFAPSPWRTGRERRGYLMSMCMDALKYGEPYVTAGSYVPMRAHEFTSGDYLWMDPFASTVRAWITNDRDRALAIVRDQFDDPLYSPAVRLVRAAIKEAA